MRKGFSFIEIAMVLLLLGAVFLILRSFLLPGAELLKFRQVHDDMEKTTSRLLTDTKYGSMIFPAPTKDNKLNGYYDRNGHKYTFYSMYNEDNPCKSAKDNSLSIKVCLNERCTESTLYKNVGFVLIPSQYEMYSEYFKREKVVQFDYKGFYLRNNKVKEVNKEVDGKRERVYTANDTFFKFYTHDQVLAELDCPIPKLMPQYLSGLQPGDGGINVKFTTSTGNEVYWCVELESSLRTSNAKTSPANVIIWSSESSKCTDKKLPIKPFLGTYLRLTTDIYPLSGTHRVKVYISDNESMSELLDVREYAIGVQ